MRTLPEVVDSIDEALALGEKLVPAPDLQRFAASADGIRKRLAYGEDFLLVALLGGTGSGKSSLLNAIAGSTVTTAGHLRPTTSEPLAWIPTNPNPGLVRLLDDMGVGARSGHEELPDLAILDMPDVDSMERSHKEAVDALLPRVDVVVWVLDPEKYNDRVLHEDYFARLAAYADQFVFVLNQTDRLEPAERKRMMADLESRLVTDGIANPRIMATAADPDFGAPIGIEELIDQLHTELAGKRVVLAKLETDAAMIARELAAHAAADSTPLGADWDTARDGAVDVLGALVAGGDYQEILEGAGRVKASIKTAGPLGLVWGLLKRNPLTRALGVRVAEELIDDASARWASRTGIEGAIAPVSAAFTSAAGGSLLDHRVRTLGNDIEGAIRAAVDGARKDVGDAAHLKVPAWWTVMAILKWLAFGSVVAGLIWAFADPLAIELGEWPVPFLMVLGGVLVGLLAWVLGRSGGARAGRKSVQRFRGQLKQALKAQLDRRIGQGIRLLEAERLAFAESVEKLQERLRQA